MKTANFGLQVEKMAEVLVTILTMDNTWEIFNTSNTPALPSNDVYHAYTTGNYAYLGTWGFGFVEVNGENKKLFNSANTGMQGIPQNPNFLVITGFGKDSRSNLWVLNYWAVDRKTLIYANTR